MDYQINLDDLVYQFYEHQSTAVARYFLTLVPNNRITNTVDTIQLFKNAQIGMSFDALVTFYELMCVGLAFDFLPSDPGVEFTERTTRRWCMNPGEGPWGGDDKIG